jgi:hypothetical protein
MLFCGRHTIGEGRWAGLRRTQPDHPEGEAEYKTLAECQLRTGGTDRHLSLVQSSQSCPVVLTVGGADQWHGMADERRPSGGAVVNAFKMLMGIFLVETTPPECLVCC